MPHTGGTTVKRKHARPHAHSDKDFAPARRRRRAADGTRQCPKKKQLSMGTAPRRCGAELACAWQFPLSTLPHRHSDARADVHTHARADRDALTHVCSHVFFSSGGHGSLRACTPSGPRCEACGTGGVLEEVAPCLLAAQAGHGQASTAASASSGSKGSMAPRMPGETRSAWFAA